jgi:hypothetical protein
MASLLKSVPIESEEISTFFTCRLQSSKRDVNGPLTPRLQERKRHCKRPIE